MAARRSTGRSLTELQLLSLALTDVPLVGDTGAALGTLSSLADGRGDGFAQLLSEGATVADQTVADRRFEGSATGDEVIGLGTLGDLGVLPVDVPAVVSLGGLATGTETGQTDGERTGSADISALTTTIGSVGLDAITDTLTTTLDDLLGELTGALGGLDGLGVLDLLALASTGDVQAAVVPGLDDLTELLGQVDGLPLGDGLDGLPTIGLDLEVAQLSAVSGFLPDLASAPDDPSDPDGPGGGGDGPGGEGPDTDAPEPVVPRLTSAPGTSTTPVGGAPAGDLPRTGGGLTSLLGLAMLGAAAIPRWRRA